jgi:hypothetical protein
MIIPLLLQFLHLYSIYYKETIISVVIMPLLIIVSTCPFLLATYTKKHIIEKYYFLNLFAIWFLCLIYITINDTFRLPIGMICAILIVYKTNFNKFPKIIALLIGIMALLLSSLIYSLLH